MSNPLPAEVHETTARIQAWLSEHSDQVPAEVQQALNEHARLVLALSGSSRRLQGLLTQLRRSLGIEPKSERRRSGDPLGALSGADRKRPQSPREKLETHLARLDRLSQWHDAIAERQKSQMERTQKKLERMPIEEVELTPEQEAKVAAKTADLIRSYSAGDGADPALQTARETLIAGAEVRVEDDYEYVPAPEEAPGEQVVKTLVDNRVRYDFELVMRRIDVEVEKKVVVGSDGSRRVLSSPTTSLGPSRYAVTWGFLVNLTLFVAQYCMPMNRLARLLSTPDKKFTTTSLSRMLRYVAEHFAPIYLYLFDQLADASVLAGDDTSVRVLEVKRHFARGEPDEPPPWSVYRNVEAATQQLECAGREGESSPGVGLEPGLAVRLAAEMGFEFPQRAAGKGPKKALHTTALSGRSDPNDPNSLIVLYRTHLGGLGNLLEVALSKRSPSAKQVVVQSDLATVNLITDETLLERFAIVYAGCASHARRPFAQYEQDDPELATYMLNFFKGIAIHEHGLDLHGRNSENVTQVRGKHSRRTWEDIRQLAEIMTHKWSKETHLGGAARYILRHYDKLTAYLDDPRLEPSNNLSERMLRMEKLIESGSMFRATLQGRFVLDILRTILQTSVAAGAAPQQYLLSILTTPAAEIEAHPERYTPRAWAKRQSEADSLQADGVAEALSAV